MKLAAYVRVSTNGQVRDGYGLPIQRQEIRRWASAHSHRIPRGAWFSDEGVSGTKDHYERTGLETALQTVCAREVDGLVIAKLDRLGRRLDVQEAALAHVWRCGARVFATDQGEIFEDDPDDPMRTAMRQMAGVFSQLERGMIVQRLRGGRRAKREATGRGEGAPPFGYTTKDGGLIPSPAEQEALEIMRLGRSQGLSLREIANALTLAGCKPRRSDRWHPGVIADVVRREGA